MGAPAQPLTDGVTLGNSADLSRWQSPDQGHINLGLRAADSSKERGHLAGASSMLCNPSCEATVPLGTACCQPRRGLTVGLGTVAIRSLLHLDSYMSLEGVPSPEAQSNNSQLLASPQGLSFLCNYPANKKCEHLPWMLRDAVDRLHEEHQSR